jgi:hypothetical protein
MEERLWRNRMKIEAEFNTTLDQESKDIIIGMLDSIKNDVLENRIKTVGWSVFRNTVPVIKEGTEEGEILGYNKDPKVFTCTISYSGETEFIPVDLTTAKE